MKEWTSMIALNHRYAVKGEKRSESVDPYDRTPSQKKEKRGKERYM